MAWLADKEGFCVDVSCPACDAGLALEICEEDARCPACGHRFTVEWEFMGDEAGWIWWVSDDGPERGGPCHATPAKGQHEATAESDTPPSRGLPSAASETE